MTVYFDNKDFDFNGMHLIYKDGRKRRFVARFKHGGMVAFKKFLRENFTVDEYFDLLENEGLAPLKILETKGYVSPTVAKILKQRGYPTTLAGRDQMIRDDIDRRAVAEAVMTAAVKSLDS